MTFKFLRPALAIALALTLGACGGKASFTIAGTASGLKYQGLVLNSNGMDLNVAPGTPTATTPVPTVHFAFPNSISYGEVYEVSVKTQPAHQTCAVGAFADASGKVTGGAKDTAGRLATIDVGVMCSVNAYTIGGTVKGLTTAGLQLTNGSDPAIVTVTATGSDVAFTFPNSVPFDTTYGVTVLTQPTDAFCTVSPSGTGTMGDAAVANIVVSCASTKTN